MNDSNLPRFGGFHTWGYPHDLGHLHLETGRPNSSRWWNHTLDCDQFGSALLWIFISQSAKSWFFPLKWPGWWFGTFFIFHILGIIIPNDFHMFQRGRAQPPTRWPFKLYPQVLNRPSCTVLAGGSQAPKSGRSGFQDAAMTQEPMKNGCTYMYLPYMFGLCI